jgi:LysM repeat protein
MAIDYTVFYASKGAAYKKEKVVKWSHYFDPVDHRAGRVGGNSRIWGDASQAVQRHVIDSLIVAAKKKGFDIRRIAMLLAMANIESGFNPDASAGTTSASGLGQFINATGLEYGLHDGNRFDLAANVAAIIAYFKYNEKLVKKHGKPDVWVYKYHHDGPTRDYGGEKLTNKKFAPLAAKYEAALNVGHALQIQDPGGAPIPDAVVRITQAGKTTVLKTDEKGALPRVVANPEKGPLTIAIQKANEEFKELGEIAISGWNSVWTVISPKQKFPVKTYLHTKPATGAPAAPAGLHKVEKGETISRIAILHQTTYQELAALNGIAKPYLIYPGQKLKVPPKKGAKPAAVSAPAKPQAPAQTTPAKPPSATTTVPAKPTNGAQPPAKGGTTAAPTVPPKPVVVEKRSEETKLPEANVFKPVPSDRINRMMNSAKAHKEPAPTGYCLRYVKNAMQAAGYFNQAHRPGTEHAKDFCPVLAQLGFENLLVTKAGIDLNTAPLGSIIIYRPQETQRYVPPGQPQTEISGHIDIKCEVGGQTKWLSDYQANNPAYKTSRTTMASPVNKKYGASFKVIGIWYKE